MPVLSGIKLELTSDGINSVNSVYKKALLAPANATAGNHSYCRCIQNRVSRTISAENPDPDPDPDLTLAIGT